MTVLLFIMNQASMTETEFLDFAETSITELCEKLADRFEDLDYYSEGRVFTIEVGSSRPLIVNIQGALEQIWLASPLGGERFFYDGSHWVSLKDPSLTMEKAVLSAVEVMQ